MASNPGPALAQAGSATPASAEVKARVKALFQQGETAYRVGKFADALEHFRAALKLYNRASIVLNVAQCYRQLKQTNQALFFYKLYMTQWARENPDRPSPYTEEVSRHIAALQEQAERSSRSSLVLTSRPPGARIWLDGRELAMTSPATLKDLSPGKHSVVLRKDALHYTGSVELKPGAQTELVAILEEITASVAITTVPDGAQVLVQDRPAGSTPLILKLPIGQATIELRKEGWVTARRLVKVDSPHDLKVNVSLQKLAKIVVTSTPSGATVFIDGKGTGITPAELPVDPGQHSVRLVLAGRDPTERQLTLTPGQEIVVHEELELSQELKDRKKRRSLMKGLGWAGVSLGIVATLGGAVLTIYGQVTGDEARDAYQQSSVQSRMDAAIDDQVFASTVRGWGIATASVGVALIIAGAVSRGLAPEAVPESITVGVAPARGGGFLGLGGTF